MSNYRRDNAVNALDSKRPVLRCNNHLRSHVRNIILMGSPDDVPHISRALNRGLFTLASFMGLYTDQNIHLSLRLHQNCFCFIIKLRRKEKLAPFRGTLLSSSNKKQELLYVGGHPVSMLLFMSRIQLSIKIGRSTYFEYQKTLQKTDCNKIKFFWYSFQISTIVASAVFMDFCYIFVYLVSHAFLYSNIRAPMDSVW